MTILQRILLVFIGGTVSTVLICAVYSAAEEIIFAAPRNLFGFLGGLTVILFLIWGLYSFVFAAILSFSYSLKFSIILSIIFSFLISLKTFFNAFETYNQPDYFDREMFTMDVVLICANFIIYPLTAFLMWSAGQNFFSTNS